MPPKTGRTLAGSHGSAGDRRWVGVILVPDKAGGKACPGLAKSGSRPLPQAVRGCALPAIARISLGGRTFPLLSDGWIVHLVQVPAATASVDSPTREQEGSVWAAGQLERTPSVQTSSSSLFPLERSPLSGFLEAWDHTQGAGACGAPDLAAQ